MAASNHRITILVADDDATIRANLALLLRSENYGVLEAADGLEASATLETGRAALALLDLSMPGLDGMEVLRRHADRLEETPVIVITAYGGSRAAIEAMKLGPTTTSPSRSISTRSCSRFAGPSRSGHWLSRCRPFRPIRPPSARPTTAN